jgi:Reverse transcriptase (RNA-dependent DNA polymerase)
VLAQLLSSVLTARLMQHVPLHDHQYAFRKNRGTHQPLFALATVIQARKHAELSTYAFFLDVKMAYDTVPHDALMYKLHCKGIHGDCLRVIQAMYAGASSRGAYGGSVSEPYPIGQGVAQGCPMSPLLYAVFIDDLLHDLHSLCADDGIQLQTPTADQYSHVAQSYADDLVGVAVSGASLQRIINVVHAHSTRWQWDANVIKSHVAVFNPLPNVPAQEMADCPVSDRGASLPVQSSTAAWFWGRTELPVRRSVKYLGIWFNDDCTWTLQATEALAKGRRAFHKWRPIIAHPHLHVSAKLEALRSYLLPVVTYGMEVWAPPVPRRRGRAPTSSPAFHSGFKDLEALLCNCLYTICGLLGQGGSWQDRACAASDVLRHDTAVLPMAAEIDLAHLRMLREVMRRVDNADDALLRDPLVAAVHSSCQSLTPTSWLAQCSAERNTFRAPLLSQATGFFAPGSVIGLASALRSVWIYNCTCCYHSVWSLLPVQAGWPASQPAGCDPPRTCCAANGVPACALPSHRPGPHAPVVAPARRIR